MQRRGSRPPEPKKVEGDSKINFARGTSLQVLVQGTPEWSSWLMSTVRSRERRGKSVIARSGGVTSKLVLR